jgi:hypothetical protein
MVRCSSLHAVVVGEVVLDLRGTLRAPKYNFGARHHYFGNNDDADFAEAVRSDFAVTLALATSTDL